MKFVSKGTKKVTELTPMQDRILFDGDDAPLLVYGIEDAKEHEGMQLVWGKSGEWMVYFDNNTKITVY